MEFRHPGDDRMRLAIDRPNVYGGTVHHVHDGDTIYALVWDPLTQLYLMLGCRVKGVQAPELTDPGGPDVRGFLAGLAPADVELRISNLSGYPRSGHVTVDIAVKVQKVWIDVAWWLLNSGYAVVWDGTGKKPVVPWPPAPKPSGVDP